MKNDLFLLWNVLFGLFLLTSVSQAARATTLILGKSKPDPVTGEVELAPVPAPTSEEPPTVNNTIIVGNTTIKLTGNPQIDYIYDPNLPRELNGFNLTDYPFYVSLPEEIDFKCDGLHDGFYASVVHKCQVYHHCLFGTRYDFLCANYTAFDQKTFICHFASEVDCKNSPKYFKRNEALYKQDSTTTLAPVTTTSSGAKRSGNGGRGRRPSRRRKPTYEYYDEYEDYSDVEYEDSGSERRNKKPRPEKDSDSSEGDVPTAPNKSLFERPRVAPKIRRPVPLNERGKYDYTGDSRLLPAKESSDQEASQEEEEKTDNRKQKGKPNGDSDAGSVKDKDIERDRDRYREKDRDRSRGRDSEEDNDRHRGREKERHRVRDDERERDRDDERDRPRLRGDDRESERERPRRPGKKRRRPDSYASDYYDDEYEEVRRPRPRDRPYDEEEDYEYDDRYYRKPLRPRDRVREREREKDRPYRTRERDYDVKPAGKGQRNRDYDDEDDVASKDAEDRPSKAREKPRNRGRDSERYNSEEDSYSVPVHKQSSSASTQKDAVELMPKKGQNGEERKQALAKFVPRKEKVPKSDEASYYDDEEEESTVLKKKVPSRERSEQDVSEEVPDSKPRYSVQRPRVTTVKTTTQQLQNSEENSPVPAPRPAYITKPNAKPIRTQQDTPTRKPTGHRRGSTQKPSLEQSSEDSNYSIESSSEVPTPTTTQRSFRGSFQRTRSRGDSPHPFTSRTVIRTTEATVEDNPSIEEEPLKPNVPLEPADDEELAPRAPKLPAMSSKRRPFLPSRGGDPTLLRGLTSVGAKAFTLSKTEDGSLKPSETPRSPGVTNSRERFSSKPTQQNFESAKYPTGIEFRARLTAGVGVEQPKYASELQQDTPSLEEDYSGEISDSIDISQSQETEKVQNVRPIVPYKQTDRPPVPLRPTLKTTDFPQLGLPGPRRGQEELPRINQQTSEESRERKYSSQFSNGNFNRQAAVPQQQSNSQTFQHLGPQTFYSENPKFKTAVTLGESSIARPTPSNVNYNSGTHIPSYYQPVLKPGQGQVQIVHLQKPLEYSNTPLRKSVPVKFPQPGNLEETDEYDVSFNDALQPISSLHPRNAQTGLIVNQQNVPSRRRYSTESIDNSRKKVAAQRIAESNVQTQFALPPLRPFQQQGDFLPLFS